MKDTHAKFLEAFPDWLKSLPADALSLLAAVRETSLPSGAREVLAGGLNYLFKSLDLIPDGIDDIGYLDDAFVLRMAASEAGQHGLGDLCGGPLESLNRLSGDTALIREFLGEEVFGRLAAYVDTLRRGSARGRTVADLLEGGDAWKSFSSEIQSFHQEYESPSFTREEKTLIKLRAFFEAKLPE